MGKRLGNFWRKPEALSDIRRFFLACEFKPNSKLWSVLEPVAYDIVPAFTYGKLGVFSYDPTSYSIVSLDNQDEPLIGYLVTITNPDGIYLLDKIKNVNGKNSYSTHYRTLAHVFTEPQEVINAWCYLVTPHVMSNYKQVEQVEWGMWDKEDVNQLALLEKITNPEG